MKGWGMVALLVLATMTVVGLLSWLVTAAFVNLVGGR